MAVSWWLDGLKFSLGFRIFSMSIVPSHLFVTRSFVRLCNLIIGCAFCIPPAKDCNRVESSGLTGSRFV